MAILGFIDKKYPILQKCSRCVIALAARQESDGRRLELTGTCPASPALQDGAKGRNIKGNYLAEKPCRACPVRTGWPGSFTFTQWR